MLKKLIKEYIYENKKIVIGLTFCIIIGFLVGLLIYQFCDKNTKDTLVNQMFESISVLKEGDFIKTEVIYNGIRNNTIYIFFVFIFSIMLYGTILIYLLYVLKGISIGIYVGTLFGIFGLWWGIVVVMILVALVNLVYIPAIIYIGTTFINYNLILMDYKREAGKILTIPKMAIKIFPGIIVVFSSIIVEQLISNIVINIVEHV